MLDDNGLKLAVQQEYAYCDGVVGFHKEARPKWCVWRFCQSFESFVQSRWLLVSEGVVGECSMLP